MIFHSINSDEKVFINDKIRFNVSETFLSPDETFATPISHEASFDAGVTWFDITTKKEIDWQFTSVGAKEFKLRITTLLGSQVFTKTITCLDSVVEKLFSNDFELSLYENDILKWLPKKWTSWNLIHLKSQELIINTLYEKSILDINGKPYTKDDLFNVDKIKSWSCVQALYLIYFTLNNQKEDIFAEKVLKYEELLAAKMSTAIISLDFNKNGVDDDNFTDNRSTLLVRT